MSNKTYRWTQQILNQLKKLKEQQIQNKKVVDWENISEILNLKFNGNWSAKQCREKYVNYARFLGNNRINQDWTRQELEFFVKLYEQHGPSWTYFSSLLPNRSQCSIKNRFNNNLKRIVKMLAKHEKQIFKQNKRNISFQTINSLMAFVNQIEKLVNDLGLTLNKQSNFFRFRTKIINMCILNCELPEQEVTKLVQIVRELNSKCKSFGAFKEKNRQWKLSYKGLLSICQFDKVVQQQLSSAASSSRNLNNTQPINKKSVATIENLKEQISSNELPDLIVEDYINSNLFRNDVQYFDQEIFQILGQNPNSSNFQLI